MPSEDPQTPKLTPSSLSHLCARYLQAQFKFKLNTRSFRSAGTPAAPPLLLPDTLVLELDRIAHHLVDAFLNPIEVSWDVVRYAAALPKKPGLLGNKGKEREDSHQKKYPPLNKNKIRIARPCIIIDLHGNILAWYLPRILNECRQGKIWTATEKLDPLLEASQKELEKEAVKESMGKKGRRWRYDPKLYHSDHRTSLNFGAVNLSPAWFELGHEWTQEFPQAAKIFESKAALSWLDSIAESSSILNAILAVIHPELYEAARETLKRLKNFPEILRQDVLSRWTSVFNGVAVISQRDTPPHRDGQSMPYWYDMLATLGQYPKCDLNLPGLGLTLDYSPGTVVGLLGMVLEHEVTGFKGERLCYAYFMRDRVHEWAKVSSGTWMNMKHYEVE